MFGLSIAGSSPRVRGTVLLPAQGAAFRRFIPARAGNGKLRRKISATHPVHPRACGERTIRFRELDNTTGSSPRVRGTGSGAFARASHCRFIPARAGNGPFGLADDGECPVHPRACGERETISATLAAAIGSSPRVRGTGKLRVHPRACGERSRTLSCGHGGSSPRVRGTVADVSFLAVHGRFIPARAGNGSEKPCCHPLTVHPRACGERTSTTQPASMICRFIPARAGNGS